MNRHLAAPVLLTVAALLLGVAGCSDPEGSSDDASPGVPRTTAMPVDPETQAGLHEYVDALAAGLVAQEAPMDERQARCFSDGLIDVVGLERIQALGGPADVVERTRGLDFRALELTRRQGEEVYDQFEVCDVDVRASTLADVSKGMTAKQQRCLARAVTGDRVREYYVTLMVEGPAPAEAEKPDKPDESDKDGKSGESGKGDKSGKDDESGKGGKGDKGDKSDKGDRPGKDGTPPDRQGRERDRDDAQPRDPGDSPLMRAMVRCLR